MDDVLAIKTYVDESLRGDNILKGNQSEDNYLTVSISINVYNFTKYDKIQYIDQTVIKQSNQGGYLFQNWKFNCIDKNGNGKINILLKSTKSSTPTNNSGAKSRSPIGNSFKYIKASSGNSG